MNKREEEEGGGRERDAETKKKGGRREKRKRKKKEERKKEAEVKELVAEGEGIDSTSQGICGCEVGRREAKLEEKHREGQCCPRKRDGEEKITSK